MTSSRPFLGQLRVRLLVLSWLGLGASLASTKSAPGRRDRHRRLRDADRDALICAAAVPARLVMVLHARSTMYALRAPLLGTIIVTAFALTGCPKEDPIEKVHDEINRAGEKVEDAFDKDGPIEEAGETIDDAADDLKETVE